MEDPAPYNQHIIRLLPMEMPEGGWFCTAGAFKSGSIKMAPGFPIHAKGATKNEAMEHALTLAKDTIDSSALAS
jgi:hypothetical protein